MALLHFDVLTKDGQIVRVFGYDSHFTENGDFLVYDEAASGKKVVTRAFASGSWIEIAALDPDSKQPLHYDLGKGTAADLRLQRIDDDGDDQ